MGLFNSKEINDIYNRLSKLSIKIDTSGYQVNEEIKKVRKELDEIFASLYNKIEAIEAKQSSLKFNQAKIEKKLQKK